MDGLATCMRRSALSQQMMQTLPQMRGFAQPQGSD
ncbi:hypothetical protein XGA_0948 [Xanthomonas hortorum ATCC 19865]|nr:hypothetical protein XGA_0948 [Xanthomonas hortorum ATCC 19865]